MLIAISNYNNYRIIMCNNKNFDSEKKEGRMINLWRTHILRSTVKVPQRVSIYNIYIDDFVFIYLYVGLNYLW